MIGFMYRLLLTFNATSLIIVVFLVKEGYVFSRLADCPDFVSFILFACVPFFMTSMSLWLARFLEPDEVPSGTTHAIESANNSFLPSYLGYFFVALSVPNVPTLIFVFSLLFIFTFLSQTLYFNPIFLIFRYHFYYVTTVHQITLFVISRRRLKDPKGVQFTRLCRINDFTFIDQERAG